MLNLIKLENRIVLDGAGVGEVKDHGADHDAHAVENVKSDTHEYTGNEGQNAVVAEAAALIAESDASPEPLNVVLIADNLPDTEILKNAVDPNAEIIVYDSDSETPEDVIDRVVKTSEDEGRQINSLTLLSHGGAGYFELGDQDIDIQSFEDSDSSKGLNNAWDDLKGVMDENAHIYLYGCRVAADSGEGIELINELADKTGAEVFASDDVTGKGGDWDMEAVSEDGHSSGSDAHPPMDFASLDGYSGDLQNELIFVPPTSVIGNEDARSGIVITLFVKDDIDPDNLRVTAIPENSSDPVIDENSIIQPALGSQTLYEPTQNQTQPPDGYTGYTWVALYSPEPNAFHTGNDQSPITVTVQNTVNSSISNSETYTLDVSPLNDAPVLVNPNGNQATTENFEPIILTDDLEEDDPDPDGQLLSSLINTRITDVDAGDPEGIAVVGVDNSRGQWQYNIGSGWADLSDNVSETNATLLADNAQIRFVPEGEWAEDDDPVQLQFRGWDQTDGGSSGDTGVNTDLGPRPSPPGDTAPFSVAVGTIEVAVIPVNDSPVVNSGLELDDIVEDTLTQGETVADLIERAEAGGGDFITDPDGPDVGIAIVGVNTTFGNAGEREDAGTWQYNVGNGWVDFGSVSNENALVLDPTAEIRFVPNADWNSGDDGQLQPSFTFRGWDQSDGSASGTNVDASAAGGSSAFSDNTEQGIITVSPVNDAPILDNSEGIGNPYDMNLDPIDEDDMSSPGNTVSEIIDSSQANGGNAITDVDSNDFTDNSTGIPDTYLGEGIAVVDIDTGNILTLADGSTTGEGNRWEYSLDDGTTWQPFDSNLSDTNAVVLDSTAKIRFVPDANWHGTAELNVRAWDLTDGLVSGQEGVNALNEVGPPNPPNDTSPYSENREIVAITVNPVNDPPEIDLDSSQDGTGYSTTYPAGDEGVPLTNDGILDDIDDTDLTRLSIEIENPDADDTLGFNTGGTNISGEYSNGVLLLTGLDSIENYRQVLNTISFSNSNSDILGDSTQRVVNITFKATDNGDATGNPATSLPALAVVTIVPGGPNVGEPDTATFIEGCDPVMIAELVEMTSPTGNPIDSLLVTITNVQPDDVLDANVDGTNITKSYENGVLTLDGTDSVENYKQVLNSITFENTSDSPNTVQRNITYQVTDSEGRSDDAQSLANVVPVNDAPINELPGQIVAPINTSVTLDNISISDVDAGNGEVLVTLRSDFGVLQVVGDGSGAEINNNGGSIVTVEGTVAQVNAALQGLTYTPLTDFEGQDRLTITVNDQGRTGVHPTNNVQPDCSGLIGINLTNDGQVPAFPNEGTPQDPTALEDEDVIIIQVTESDTDVVPEIPGTPDVPFLPITRPEGRDIDGITLEAVRLPGPVGITEGVGRPIFEARALAGRDFYDFCSIEESLRSHLGCRFANTLDPEAQFGSITWEDFTDLGWIPPYEHLDEEYDLYSQLFLREQGDPGFNVQANAFQRDLGGMNEQPQGPEVFEEKAGKEGFNELNPGEVKRTFFAGREHLDKTGR